MNRRKTLISLMLAASVGVSLTTMPGCMKKTEEEIKCENKIRKMIERDAGIDLVENSDMVIKTQAKNEEYIIKFSFKNTVYTANKTTTINEITYSVDKDFYYDFKNNYSMVEGEDEVNLVADLTLTYNPIKVVTDGDEKQL